MGKARALLEEEFAGDRMLKELHEIREVIEKELEGLTPQEKVRRINEEGRKFWRALGYELAPAGQGAYRIVKRKKRAKRYG